jgi:hypothetical protein
MSPHSRFKIAIEKKNMEPIPACAALYSLARCGKDLD